MLRRAHWGWRTGHLRGPGSPSPPAGLRFTRRCALSSLARIEREPGLSRRRSFVRWRAAADLGLRWTSRSISARSATSSHAAASATRWGDSRRSARRCSRGSLPKFDGRVVAIARRLVEGLANEPRRSDLARICHWRASLCWEALELPPIRDRPCEALHASGVIVPLPGRVAHPVPDPPRRSCPAARRTNLPPATASVALRTTLRRSGGRHPHAPARRGSRGRAARDRGRRPDRRRWPRGRREAGS